MSNYYTFEVKAMLENSAILILLNLVPLFDQIFLNEIKMVVNGNGLNSVIYKGRLGTF